MSELQLQKTLRKGDRGGQVKAVQEWLSLHGEHVAIDDDFGPATEAAVRDYQAGSGLDRTGVVDARTYERLTAPMRAALAPVAASGEALGALIVAYAQQHLAQHPREIGGQNRGPWVRLYMKGNEGAAWAWCAGFACFVMEQACQTLGEASPIANSFSCDAMAASAKARGRFVGSDKAGPGSFFLNRSAPTDWTHTGLVVSTKGQTFKTIEGNTNDDGSREGYEVCARTRSFGSSIDFIQV